MKQVSRQLNVAKLKMVKVVKVWKLCGGLYKKGADPRITRIASGKCRAFSFTSGGLND